MYARTIPCALLLVACASRDAAPPLTIDVPANVVAHRPTAATATLPPPDTRPVVVFPSLPSSWAPLPEDAPVLHAEAMGRARAERQIVLQLVLASDAGTLADAASFERANARVDACNRRYAAAYNASDASPSGKLDALGEASSVLLAWSDLLLRAHIQPATFRTSATVGLTYEEVVEGPSLRWRDEGEALARQVTRESSGSGKSRPQCCSPGDPLCSSSLSGWCREP